MPFPGDSSFSSSRLALALLAAGLCAALVIYARRPELLVLLGVPLGLKMLADFRTSVTITTCVMLVWLSRFAVVFFDLTLFSYAVYFCLMITLGAYALRLMVPGGRAILLITNVWVWLYIAAVLIGGLHGMSQADRIPPWLLTAEDVDYSTSWVYFRTLVLPGVFLPLLAIIIGAATVDRQKLTAVAVPLFVFALTVTVLIIGEVAMRSLSLVELAQASQRNEHLADLGFHSNEFGTLLAIAYALMLGVREGTQSPRGRTLLLFTLCATGIAVIVTFSRGAYLAFAITNLLFFMRGSPRRKAAFVVLAALLWVFAPAALFERAQYGLQSRNINDISAGRLENIWQPLLPDIADHILVGQGLHSIMWTEAQRLHQIYPVGLSHNAYLDALLDLGLIGALPVLAWYAYLWRGFRRFAQTDPEPAFRGFFHGGRLALIAFLLCAMTNDRLTPTSTNCLLWLAAGVLMGRQRLARRWVGSPVRSAMGSVPPLRGSQLAGLGRGARLGGGIA